MILHRQEKALLKKIRERGEGRVEDIAEGQAEADAFRRAALWLREKGLVEIRERVEKKYERNEECERFIKEGFPEERVLARDGEDVGSLGEEERRIGIMWAKRNGWIIIENGKIKVVGRRGEYELRKAAESPEKAKREEIEALLKRGLVSEVEKKEMEIRLTEKGRKEAEGIGEVREEIVELTHEIIVSGRWKGAQFSPYAVAPAADEPVGKTHPLTRMAEKISEIFVEMGFEEMEGPIVESAFWNFDALFQPQDHPARDLADTFYLEGEFSIPGGRLLKAVKESHEKGWKCKWSEKEAKQRVLRTHTTAVSARYLAKLDEEIRKNGGEGRKYFCVGRVFRNEATDFKHLAEFYQVEGIVAWGGANFTHLLGLLKEFYRRLGFDKVRFRPSYFPYTEPSLEVEVFFRKKGEEKGEWMELGGAGILRPEMTKPLCSIYPVLAWGLSLERPMMLMNGWEDIRELYRNNLDWLKNSRIGK